MLLRASGEISGETVDATAVTGGATAQKSGVAHAGVLLAFAEAAVAGGDEALADARADLLAALGGAAVVDAAAVVGNFQRMVRISDATGIPLDTPVRLMSVDLRAQLGIDAFAAAHNTPRTGPLGRLAGRLLFSVVGRGLRWYGERRRRRSGVPR